MTDKDTELHFLRALSVRGVRLRGDVPAQERPERIRVEILRAGLGAKNFGFGPGHSMETYAQAYERCYNARLELRLKPRLPDGQPVPGGSNYDAVIADLADKDEEDG